MPLRSLVDVLPEAQLRGSGDVEIRDIAYDSREVEPGSLFIAVPSIQGDATSGGARFLKEAIERGANSIVVQAGAPLPDGIPVALVPDARVALAALSAEFFNHPSRHLQIYAVTGTDGKTTTCFLLEQVLALAGYRVGLLGTVETKIGDIRMPNDDRMTTPESLDLQRTLRQMVDAGVTHVAMEASSHGLALERLRACRFAACALTNITGEHMDLHGTFESYFRAKASLFAELAAGKPAVLNMDDSSFERLAETVGDRLISYGCRPGARIRALEVQLGTRGSSFQLEIDGRRAPVALRMPGSFNVSNALAAAGLASCAGVSVDQIANSLSQAYPPPGRMQRIDAGQAFDVIVDYAHTPHAFRVLLPGLRQSLPTGGRLIVVFGSSGSRDRGKRPVMAQIAREYADYFVITTEDAYGEDPQAVVDDVAAGVPAEEEGERYERQVDRAVAIRKAIALARPGDLVAILGKGHEATIVTGTHKRPWSDVKEAREALGASA
jgi:UDP-N-acetylmuramoyl-L-alanyl-D-glutamate--2,6-diaminopimelate ligase